jgi:hypothetical protein
MCGLVQVTVFQRQTEDRVDGFLCLCGGVDDEAVIFL